MSNAIATFLFTVVFLLALTRAAGAQWWPMPPNYEPYYQERRVVHRARPKPKPVERHAHKPKPKPKPKPRAVTMSVDEERAWIKSRVQSFCGRHPKDVACQPQDKKEE